MNQVPEGELRVEAAMVNPPIPKGFGVWAHGKLVAVLTEATVRDALRRFDDLAAARHGTDFGRL